MARSPDTLPLAFSSDDLSIQLHRLALRTLQGVMGVKNRL